MEFMWRGTDLGGTDDIFTHVLHTHYSAPSGFDWENPNVQINRQNVDSRARVLCDELKASLRRLIYILSIPSGSETSLQARSTAYRTQHLLVPFGDDFKFKRAAVQFQNMDQLIGNKCISRC